MVATLIVVENIYHQKSGEDAHHVKNVYQHPISSDEDPWQRTYKVSSKREPLDCGWIEECGLVHIVNKGGEGKYVYISETISGLATNSIPPNCSTSIFPSTPQNAFIWADGDVKISVTVYPK